MKKRFLAMMMTAVMAAGLVGCGSGDSGKDASSNQTAADNKGGEDSKDAADGEEEKITADILVWAPSEDQSEEYGNWLQTMCEQFNEEHPNWDLTFSYGVCPESDAKNMVTTDIEAAADVYAFANDNLTDLIAANGIAKLGGETAEYVKGSNAEAIVDSVSSNGDIYGVPFTTNTWFMYYNKSMFSEDDIKSIDKMLEKGKISFPLGDSWYFASWYVANGCTLFGPDGTDNEAGIDFSGDKAAAVTDYLVDLAANKNFVNSTSGEGLAGLRDGSIGVYFSGSWDYASVKKALGDDFAAVSLPSYTLNGEEKQLLSFAGSKAFGVNPNSEYPQVSVALAKYLGSAEAQKAHYELRGIVPCNNELLVDEEIAANPMVKAQNDTFNNTSIIQPFVANMSNYWKPAENFGKAIVNGDVTHDNAAEKTEELNKSMNTSIVE